MVVLTSQEGGPYFPGWDDLPEQLQDQGEKHRRMEEERELAALIQAMDDILTPDNAGRDKQGRAVINFSSGTFRPGDNPSPLDTMFRKLNFLLTPCRDMA